jgi:geranylgeranyl reductase family protein
MEVVDVAIVGGGPAGSVCAALCAAAGLRVALIERGKFPREKVCGDCINPACWPVLERLGVAQEIRDSPSAALNGVEFIAIGGQKLRIDFVPNERGMISIKRSHFDNILFNCARQLGARVHDEATVIALARTHDRDWKIDIVRETLLARILVGADGRNSTVARLCNLLPPPERERIALQAHIPLPPDFGNRIVLQFLPEGYSGQAPVNDRELNLCLVGTPPTISSLRAWAERQFSLPGGQSWRSITPLTRAPIAARRENLFFIGDAARVVEPFTGEGIYYALGSGELAANAIAKTARGEDRHSAANEFARAHRAMYRGRLWINQLARGAVLHPRFASSLLTTPPISKPILRLLTGKIVRSIVTLPHLET